MRRLLLIFSIIMLSVLIFPVKSFAATKDEKCVCADGSTGKTVVDTSILNGCDCGEEGGAVIEILMTVVDFLSVGIGILGVIGISIVGMQYLTAGGNEEKTRKAKRRMFEIIIGLAFYVVFYAILKWLNINPV